jgi:hypothetical protein
MQANENVMFASVNANPFVGAALLDEQGQEVPITEEMIVHACHELMLCCQFPQQATA